MAGLVQFELRDHMYVGTGLTNTGRDKYGKKTRRINIKM